MGALTAAAAFIYCLDSLILLRRFLASTFDLVIFDQGIRGYAHFQVPASIARGVSDGQGPHFLLLADHWSPVLALLAPLYWIHDDPSTLLVAQGVLFALAIPPPWAYTRRQLGEGAAYFVCVAYALSLPIMAAVIFDFHEVAFVPVLTAVMVERFDAVLAPGGRPPQTPPPGGTHPTRPPLGGVSPPQTPLPPRPPWPPRLRPPWPPRPHCTPGPSRLPGSPCVGRLRWGGFWRPSRCCWSRRTWACSSRASAVT